MRDRGRIFFFLSVIAELIFFPTPIVVVGVPFCDTGHTVLYVKWNTRRTAIGSVLYSDYIFINVIFTLFSY